VEGVEHQIVLTDGDPSLARPHRTPAWKASEIQRQVDEMVAHGSLRALFWPLGIASGLNDQERWILAFLHRLPSSQPRHQEGSASASAHRRPSRPALRSGLLLFSRPRFGLLAGAPCSSGRPGEIRLRHASETLPTSCHAVLALERAGDIPKLMNSILRGLNPSV
jgi:hypothetical protein